MVFAGIDVGSLTGKCVLLKGGEILAHKVIRVKKTPVESAESVFELVLSETDVKREDVKFVVKHLKRGKREIEEMVERGIL